MVALRRAVADHVEVVESDRPDVLDHGVGGSAEGLDPLTQLRRVGHRRGQAHEADRRRGVDQDLLPDRPPVRVLEEVHLVEHDPLQAVQRRRTGVDHVAQHLGGHDHHRSVRVDGVVAGEEAHPARAEHGDQIRVLLVGQRLDRGGVEGLCANGQSPGDGVLTDDGLARPGRGRHQDVASGVDALDRLALEAVEGEVVGEGIGQDPSPSVVSGSVVPGPVSAASGSAVAASARRAARAARRSFSASASRLAALRLRRFQRRPITMLIS